MNQMRKKGLSLLLATGLALSLSGQCAAASDSGKPAPGDAAEVSQLIADYWQEDYFDQVVIDPEGGQVTVDGADTTLEETLGLTEAETETVLESAQSAEEYFQDTAYETEQTDQGSVVVTAPYQTKRIVVETAELSDTCGAEQTLYDAQAGQYVLQYATQEAAQQSYETMAAQYGADRCFVDEVIDQKDVLQSTGDGQDCVSWGAAFMGLDQVKGALEGAGLEETATVAVVDTGVDAGNALFAGDRILSQSSNFSGDGQDLSDVTGHGTHVTGIVADCTPSSVKLLVLRVFDQQGKSTALAMAKALEYAVDCQADVINLSAGWPRGQATDNIKGILNPAIEKAWQAGVPVVCAAGNDREDVSRSYPACSSQTIAVSALDETGAFDQQDSDFGSGIDFAAPGVNISSAEDGGTLCFKSGTSMAAPHLAAAIADIKLLHPEYGVETVYNTLKEYAVDLGEPGKDDWYGWGCVNLTGYYEGGTEEKRTCDNWSIQLAQTKCVYNGKEQKPAVTVWENGKKVAEKYYTAAYQNNRAVGKATVVVTGRGIYQGTVKQTFSIQYRAPDLSSLTKTSKGVALKWTTTPGASGYEVYRKSGSRWSLVKKLSSGSTVSWTDTKVSNGARYQYQVRSKVGGDTVKGEAKTTVYLSRPTLYGVRNKYSKALTADWKRNSKASGYQVQYADNSSFRKSKTVTLSRNKEIRTTMKRLTKGKSYYIRVRSYKTVSGQRYVSAWSAVKTGKVKR